MSAIRVRDFQSGDVPALARLVASLDLGLWAQGREPSEVERALESRLEARTETTTIRVAEAEGKLAGYAAAHWLPNLVLAGPEGYVSELFVAPENRGRGIGGALLDSLEAEARSRGCARLSLLNLRERESYRRGFYLKRGWTERADAANLIKKLGP